MASLVSVRCHLKNLVCAASRSSLLYFHKARCSTLPKYKLIYFNLKGRGEVSRILLTYGGKDFVDQRIEKKDWPAIKPSMLFGTIPALEVDGGQAHLFQSMALNRYLARETGLSGKDSLEEAHIDMIASTIDEILDNFFNWRHEQDPSKKKEIWKNRNEVLVPKVLTFLEDCLQKNELHSGFFVGESVSLADFCAWHALEYLLVDDDNALDKYPRLKANRELVNNLPKFAEYQKTRPVTEV